MSFEWAIVDTETTGLQDPIHIIEIAAQRMRGFKAVGDPFHGYLNHSVRIPADAIAVHGLTETFIQRNGLDPRKVHNNFEQYLGNRPFAAHNLSYDLKCINTERRRLGLTGKLNGELCTMLLSRRILPELKSVRLETLKKYFRIKAKSHRADSDVKIVARLFEQVFSRRLELLKVNTWDSLKKLSRASPVALHHELIKKEMGIRSVPTLQVTLKKESSIMKFLYQKISISKK